MSTVRDLVTDAMKNIGALAVGETASAAEAADGLSTLNDMLGTWQTESLMVYAMVETVFTWPGTGATSYTIGPGGDLEFSRPMEITAAYNRDSSNNDYEIAITRNYEDYSDIVTKSTASTLVTLIYYDPTFPLGTIRPWPVPSSSDYRLVIWTWGVLNGYTSINDTVTLPPGYRRALVYNLAMDIATGYGKETEGTKAEKVAMTSKAALKKKNLVPPTLTFTRDLTGGGYTFNWLTGQPT